MNTQTITRNEAILVKKKKIKLNNSLVVIRGLLLPIFVLISWQLLSSLGILPAQLFSSRLLIFTSFIETCSIRGTL